MAVDDDEIQRAVVVVVEEHRTESNERQRWWTNAAFVGDIPKKPVAQVAKKAVCFELVVRDEQIEPAVAVVVAEIRSHTSSRFAITGDRHASQEGDLPELPVAFVVKQEVGHGIVGHEHIGPPIIVVVANGNTEPVSAVLRDASLGTHVGKAALSVIAIEHARQALVVEGVTIDPDPLGRVAAEPVVADPAST